MKKIALGQMNIEYGNFTRNVSTAKAYITTAIDSKSDLILLPELWSSGFDLHNMEELATQNVELIKQLQAISNETGLIICGSYINNEFGNYYNSFITLQSHQQAIIYHKNHLFHQMHEDKYFTPGIESKPFKTALGVMGSCICFDLRFPEFFRGLSSKGTEIFIMSSHWPLVRINHWKVLLQARAIENQAFMIAVNSVGISGRDTYGGTSMVIAPDGKIVYEAPIDQDGLFEIEIDPSLVQKTRRAFPIPQQSKLK